jgi:protein TonB
MIVLARSGELAAPEPLPPPACPDPELEPLEATFELPCEDAEPELDAFPAAEPAPSSARRETMAVRLGSPLPRRVRPAPPPAPRVSALPRPAKRPAGETCGPRLLAEPDAPLVVYPVAARRRGLEGRVLIRILLDATGDVTAVDLLETSGHEILDRAALEAAWGWRFAPARLDGEAVSSEFVRAVRFRLVAG